MAREKPSGETGSDNGLNLAGRIAGYFIDSKLTLLVMLFAFLAGMFAFLVTPREENPADRGAGGEHYRLRNPVPRPTKSSSSSSSRSRRYSRDWPGVEHTYGMAMNSTGVVSVQFKVGQNKEDSLVKLYDRIMSNIDRMPPGTLQPLIKPADVDDVPILTISLSSSTLDDRQLRAIANDVLEHLRRVEGTSVAYVHGGRPARDQRQSRSRPPARLQRHAVRHPPGGRAPPTSTFPRARSWAAIAWPRCRPAAC